MAESPKQVPQRLTKDVREVIKEISKAPFGRASKPNKSQPMLTIAETEQAKEAAKKVSPVTIKKEAARLTPAEKDKAIKQIAKEGGISYAKAKEKLRNQLATAPKLTPVKQPTVTLPSGIPLRQEVADVAARAVSYRGKTIFLTPGQIKALGLVVDYPESSFVGGEVKTRTQYERITNITPIARQIQDTQASKEAVRLSLGAAQDWQNQARAAALNPEVRNPAEALGKTAPDSAKAEAYAERLFQKAIKELSKEEKKRIKLIIEEENRRAVKVARSNVGARMDVQNVKRASYTPVINNLSRGFNAGGLIGLGMSVFLSYKQMGQQMEQEKLQQTMN